jgi:hypothetical protein
MDDERWEPGMPVLDRQAVPGAPAAPGAGASPAGLGIRPGEEHLPPSLRGLPPRSVPETKPTPLQKHFVLLSAPALILGAIAITALELGAGFDSLVVKVCVLVAAPLLLVTTADATLRIWRSAWAWMPVDRTKGLFRLAWVVMAILFLVLIVGAVLLAVRA